MEFKMNQKVQIHFATYPSGHAPKLIRHDGCFGRVRGWGTDYSGFDTYNVEMLCAGTCATYTFRDYNLARTTRTRATP